MLGGRKQYKTKLCILYQKGRCSRPSCNFAHGDSELRRFGGGGHSSFNGRRDYRSGDLRDKLERRHSPNRRYSPGRDARNYHAFHGQRPLSHDRGNSMSRSPVRKSDRGQRRKHSVDGESDNSDSPKISDGDEDPRREAKVSKHDETYALEEQLKQMQSENEKLEDEKSQLQNYLQEKADEAHELSSRVQDLEYQLNNEQEDCKRITFKVKKFVRAHERYLKAQEELKRSQARLQRLGDQLGSDISKLGANDEDSSINIISDVEPNGDDRRSLRYNELKNDSTSTKKRAHILSATSEEAKVGNSMKRGRFSGLVTGSDKMLQSEGAGRQLENDNKETQPKKVIQNKKELIRSLTDEYKHKRGKMNSSSANLDKVKGFEVGRVLPSTSIAAHAIDELVEATELEDRSEATEKSTAYENGVADKKAIPFFMPPPPPLPQLDLNSYKQYEGNDEEVDVEKIDAETLDIDLNSEVDVEQ